MALTAPTIHLNGTSRDELHRQWSDAFDAISKAYDKLRECGPNGRDYYLQEFGALNRATEEHMLRLQKLHDVMGELQTLMELT